jgi:predicted RNase H-like HicB family nuclease
MKRNRPRRYVLPIIIEREPGGYSAWCPSLQGCIRQGHSYEEALKNLEEAIRVHIEDRLASGEPVPSSDLISLATLEVRV